MAGHTHGRRLCDCARRASAFPRVSDPSLWPGRLCCPSSKARSATCVGAARWCSVSDVGFGSESGAFSPALRRVPPRSASAGGLSSAADFCRQPSDQGLCWKRADRILPEVLPGLPGGVLGCPPHGGKPPPSFSYWLSACAQQARNGGKQLSWTPKRVFFSVQMSGHCCPISTAFKLSLRGITGRDGTWETPL